MPLPPIVQEQYTTDQLRYVAGFILRQRAGVLQALRTVSAPGWGVVPSWQDPQIRYYQDIEAYTRYLLWVCGYPVAYGEMYDGEIKLIDPRAGP